MTDDEMIERVARAICKARELDPDDMGLVASIGPATRSPNWHAYVEHARAAIAAMQPQWRPIESAKAGDRCLFFGNTRHDVGVSFSGWVALNGRLYSDADAALCSPTHWMPLPEPPHD